MTDDFPTAEDIEIYEKYLDNWQWDNDNYLVIRGGNETLKQQIISNKEVVNRLKDQINKTLYFLNTVSPKIPPQTTTYEILKEQLVMLKSILEKK